MRKHLALILSCLCAVLGAAIVVDGQQRMVLSTSAGADVPLSTTSELTHGATAPTWTAVVGNVGMSRASSSAPTAVTANQPVAPWRNLNGAAASYLVADDGATGCTPGKIVSAATTNATVIKASAGNLYYVHAANTNAAARYLKFYNKATSPTVGTDTPVLVLTLPPSGGGGADLGAAVPMAFSTGLSFAITTGAADSDTAAVALSEIVASYCWK
jgi:hypothetical protein